MSWRSLLDESGLGVGVPAWLAERKKKIGVPVGLAACNKAKICVAEWNAECKMARVGVPDCRGVACRMKAS